MAVSSCAQARGFLRVTGILGMLALGASGVSCKGKATAETRRAGVKNPFPMVKGEDRELCGRDLNDVSKAGERWTLVPFGEPLRFDRVGQTIDATAYATITLLDAGTAHAGRFAMKATYRKGYTGGPPGSATEHWVDVEDVRLVERLAPPKALPGVRAIVPGEVVVRMIREGELSRLDDRYLVELPGNVSPELYIGPLPEDYKFSVSISREGSPLALRYEGSAYQFGTGPGGLFEVRVASGARPTKQPDRYAFMIEWGDSLGAQMHEVDFRYDVKWK